ncbi:uncharacterized protein LOC132273073 [Cornus florida]|uniref:uncharacterized protein LOC132273073 n=1 Tax=Cornus florida TaxID=4283 RepID=UPI00289D9055|nr:uncharacterized protein LOC132273073 [Cornus florida]
MSSGNESETIRRNSMARDIPHRTNSQHGTTMRERLVEWRTILLLVLSLIATLTFQAAVDPPGGVWQDDSPKDVQDIPMVPNPHKAGEFVMAYNNPVWFAIFYISNLFGFIGSILTILLLIIAMAFNNNIVLGFFIITTCVTVVSVIVVFFASLSGMTPDKNIKEFDIQTSKFVNITAIGGLIMGFLAVLVSICVLIGRRRRSLSSVDANNANRDLEALNNANIGGPGAPQNAAAANNDSIFGPEAPLNAAAAANNANIVGQAAPQNVASANNANGGEIQLV